MVLPFRYAFKGRFLFGTRCPSCTLVAIAPQPTPQEIRDLYAEEYFTECSADAGAHGKEAYMDEAAHSVKSRLRAAARLDRLLRAGANKRGKLLEVGCGPGFLLGELRRLGWDVQGLEISEYAADYARNKLKLHVVVGPIEEQTFPANEFDAVFMGDVLEHLPEPHRSLAAVATWIRPGGSVAIAVPSTLSLLSAQIGLAMYGARKRFKTLRIPPYHLFEYTPRTLGAMIESAGLHVMKIRLSAVPLSKMGLRGTLVENAGKVTLQILAHATAAVFNRGGDRLLVIARKP
ncbi:MAG: methyltransferase domain-containing protein [Candidatus Eisenbacteria bacterium]